MSTLVYGPGGILLEHWDDVTRTYTAYDAEGQPTSTRPYTDEENAAADASIARAQERAEAEALAAAQTALVQANLALTEEAHQEGEAWVQPTGAHDAYPLGATVTHGGKTWESTTQFNVWEPGVSGWREQASDGYPAWVQPTGAHDAYSMGARVTHLGQDWQSTVDGNVWEPGVFGWTAVAP